MPYNLFQVERNRKRMIKLNFHFTIKDEYPITKSMIYYYRYFDILGYHST